MEGSAIVTKQMHKLALMSRHVVKYKAGSTADWLTSGQLWANIEIEWGRVIHVKLSGNNYMTVSMSQSTKLTAFHWLYQSTRNID